MLKLNPLQHFTFNQNVVAIFIKIKGTKMKQFIVYKHINKVNRKIYIGITSQKSIDRWGSNGKRYKRHTYFANAIQKYGWDNFEHKILIHGLTEEQAKRWETKLIKFYKCNNHSYGYNSTFGGDLNIPNDKTIQKILNTRRLKGIDYNGKNNPNYGKHHSEETKRKISKALKGKRCKENHHNYGKHLSEETKQIIKRKNQLYKNRCKKVYCPELHKVFFSVKEVYRQLGIDFSSVSKVCRGINKKAGGFTFTYDIPKNLL